MNGAGGHLVTIDGNSLIEDAANALTINSASGFSVDNVIFNCNTTGISFGSTTSTIPSSIFTSVFTSRVIPTSYFHSSGPLNEYLDNTSTFSPADVVTGITQATPWASQNVHATSAPSVTGIASLSVHQIQIGDDGSAGNLNTFDNLSIGIKLTFTQAIIYNNQFLNMVFSSTRIGTGINAAGTTSQKYTLVIGGAGSNQPNTFRECNRGINIISYAQVTIDNNDLSVISTAALSNSTTGVGRLGIYWEPADYGDNYISNNSINNYQTAITVSRLTAGYDALEEITIDANTITSDGTAGMHGSFCKYGMNLSDVGTSLEDVDEYKVSNSNITNVYNGIVATGIQAGLTIYDNATIDIIYNPITPHLGCGIQIASCFKPRVINNTITSTDANVETTVTSTIPNYEGIYDNASTKAVLLCNSISGLGESITFKSAPGNSVATNNSMSTGINGFALRGSATVLGATANGDATDPCGESWNLGTFTYNTYVDAACTNANTQSILYVEDPGPASGYITLPATATNGGGANAYVVGTGLASSLGSCCGGTAFDCGGITILAMTTHNSGNKSLVSANTKELLALATDSTQYSEYGAENQYQSKALAYRILDNTGAATDDTTGILQSFYNNMQATVMGALQNVENAIAVKDYVSANSINNAVIASNTIEVNKKQINYYFLLKLADTTYQYSAADSSAIYSVASQCWSTGGNVVWQARVMYFDILGYSVDFNDNCHSEDRSLVNIGNSSVQKNSDFKLYPNPTNGSFTLDYHLGDNDSGILSIYDVAGKLIRNYSLNSSTTTAIVNVSQLEAGVYIYSVLINNAKVKTDRLIIIK